MSRAMEKTIKPRGSSSADKYYRRHKGVIHETLIALRELVKATLPTATEDFKWGAPVYTDRNGFALCYIFALRDHVNLGFLCGAQLKDPRAILEGNGKQGRHIKVFKPGDIRKTEFRELLRDAAHLARRQAKGGIRPSCNKR